MATPYQEGFRACRAGDTIHQNPYATFTDANSEWQKGWQAQDEHMNGVAEALDSIGWHGTAQ
jgi:ribosome modulation factor